MYFFLETIIYKKQVRGGHMIDSPDNKICCQIKITCFFLSPRLAVTDPSSAEI